MKRLITISLAVVLCLPFGMAAAGDEAETIKQAVLAPQEAGWARHDFKTYMSQWADKAQIVIARGEKPGKYDTVFNRKQIEATRQLLMQDKPAQNHKITFANVKVTVDGNEAELRLRSTLAVGEDYQIADEIFQLRKTSTGWKVQVNRGWLIKAKFGKAVITYDADTWKKLDEDADQLLKSDRRGDKTVQALLLAFRFQEAHALAKKITVRKDVTAADWAQRGQAAMDAGDAGDAVAAFRQALKLDKNAAVPPFARK